MRTDGKTNTGIAYSELSSPTSRDTLALVMGYGGSRETWPSEFLDALAQRYRVVTLDNRGTGESLKPTEPADYTIAAMSADLNAVLEQVGASEVHLLGYSLGGCIAQDFAWTHRKKVRSLVLLSTTAGGALYTSPPVEMLKSLANPEGNTLWELYLSTWRHCMSPEALQRYEPVLREIVDASCKHLTPRSGLRGHLNAYKHFQAAPHLSALTMPVLVATGENDRLTPMANSRALAEKIPNSRLLVIPDCEHAPHIEARDELLGEIFSFCSPR